MLLQISLVMSSKLYFDYQYTLIIKSSQGEKMNIKKIKTIMEKRNMTQYKLAKLSGVNEGNLSVLLRNESCDPRLSTVEAIAKALDVEITEIV